MAVSPLVVELLLRPPLAGCESAQDHYLYTVDAFASFAECECLIAAARKLLAMSTAHDDHTAAINVRERIPLAASHEATRQHAVLMRRLLLLLETRLPALTHSLFGRAAGLGEMRAMYSAGEPAVNIYQPSGEFAPHTDNEQLTLLIQLDPDGAFEGGGTAFWGGSHLRPADGEHSDRDSWLPPLHACKLAPGGALIFGGSVTHAGLPISAGTRHVYVVSFTLKQPVVCYDEDESEDEGEGEGEGEGESDEEGDEEGDEGDEEGEEGDGEGGHDEDDADGEEGEFRDDGEACERGPVRALVDLPDELLLAVLQSTDSAAAVAACAGASRGLHALSTDEALWRSLCCTQWPLHATPHRACAPAHLRELPPASWRALFRGRVVGAAAPALGSWRALLPLYDETLHLAGTRPDGWVVALGTLLLRIERLRKHHGLSASPLRRGPVPPPRTGPPSGESAVLRTHCEATCWYRSLQATLTDHADAVLALAESDGDSSEAAAAAAAAAAEQLAASAVEHPGVADAVVAAAAAAAGRSAGTLLDIWHELIERRGGAGVQERAGALLLAAFVARSALEAILNAFDDWGVAPWLKNAYGRDGGRTRQGSRVLELARRLRRATEALDEAIHSLRQEGCDCSVTAAQRGAAAVAPVSRAHWWWWIEPPIFVLSGCPLIDIQV